MSKKENDTQKNINTAIGIEVLKNESINHITRNKYLGQHQSHGIIAEVYNHRLDQLQFKNPKHIGGTNIKNGADRISNGIEIQTKFYKTSTGTINSAFEKNGNYKYLSKNGKPMLLEVPKDQYKDCLKQMEKKIMDGKVKGITNPQDASKIIKSGNINYSTAVKISKAGTVDSLLYDVTEGFVKILNDVKVPLASLVATVVSYMKDGDLEDAVVEGIKVGAELSLALVTASVVQDQLIRTVAGKQVLESLGKNATQIIGVGVFFSFDVLKNIHSVVKDGLHPKTAMKNIGKKGMAYAGVAAGAATGAKIGATFGSLPGAVIGTAVGVAGGLLGNYIGEKMFGYKQEEIEERLKRISNKIEGLLQKLDFAEVNNIDMKSIREYILSNVGISQLMENYDNFEMLICERIMKESQNFEWISEIPKLNNLLDKILLKKDEVFNGVNIEAEKMITTFTQKFNEIDNKLEIKLDF